MLLNVLFKNILIKIKENVLYFSPKSSLQRCHSSRNVKQLVKSTVKSKESQLMKLFCNPPDSSQLINIPIDMPNEHLVETVTHRDNSSCGLYSILT